MRMENELKIDMSQGQVNMTTGNGTMIVNNISCHKRNIEDVSAYLRSWYAYIYKEEHIDREETDEIFKWVKKTSGFEQPKDRVMLLVGDAGSGKSVVMRDLLIRLEGEEIPVLGIKSDIVFSNKGELDAMIGLERPTAEIIKDYAQKGLVVVLIDQIDALSSVLTSDRGSLHSINTFVDEISTEPNVRIVVSCRPYDQQYDPSLERYSLGHHICMGVLPMTKVEEILNIAGIEVGETEVKVFLQNPLNLYIFCKINNGKIFNRNRPSRTLLYEALWKQVIIDGVRQSDHTDTEKLTKSLDGMTSEMYERQALTISYEKIESLYPYELSYLSSSNFVYAVQEDGMIQFIHQSLFDYVYARLFLRNGKTIDDILSGVHQGLFIRLRLKQILFYLRDVDQNAYFENLNILLFSKHSNGRSKYRFHLKHLMLTNIGFQKSYILGEADFIENRILSDNDFAAIYLDSVNTKVGLEIYNKFIADKGGSSVLPESEQMQYLNACERVMCDDALYATGCLLSVDVEGLKPKAQQRYGRIIDRIPISETLIENTTRLLDKIEPHVQEMSLGFVLTNLIPFHPEYVQDWLFKYIKNEVDKLNNTSKVPEFRVGYEIQHVYDVLKKQQPKVAYKAGLRIIQYLCEKTSYDLADYNEIKTSRTYLCYERGKEYSDFVEDLLTDLLDYYDEVAKDRQQEIVEILHELSLANLDGLVLIPTSAYKVNVTEYIEEAFELSKRIILADPASSVLKYHAKELFRVMFPLLNRNQKDEIMKILANYNPNWEKKPSNIFSNGPVTYIGYSKAQYYALIDPKELLQYGKAKKLLDEQQRIHKSVENVKPFHMEMKMGWTKMDGDFYTQKSAESLAKTMVEINKDDYVDWNKPTKTGHALAIKQQISNRPDDIYEAYLLALKDEKLDIDYPLSGIEEFLKIGYDRNKVNALVDKILDKLDNVLANNSASHVIQVARLVDRYYENNVPIPQVLFDFVCHVAKEWDDSEYNSEEGQNMSYQEGINQVRGCAAEVLLHCYQYTSWANEIFDTLFEVARTGSVPTRAAVLLRLAVLLHMDKERCFELFMAMMHDYPASLLALPLHDQNPLLYMINNHFNDLAPYFEACIKEPRSHKETVILLWFAWIRNLDGAETLLYRMADVSSVARASLIHAIWHHYQPQYKCNTLPILYRYVDYDEKETGESYDYIFERTIRKFSKQEREAFLKTYVQSAACKYCAHYFTEYMSELSKEEPYLCLDLLPDIYMHNKDACDWGCTPSRLIDYLITSYNAIKKYDKEDPILEKTLDLMDEWLHENVNRQYLFNCFRLLDN